MALTILYFGPFQQSAAFMGHYVQGGYYPLPGLVSSRVSYPILFQIHISKPWNIHGTNEIGTFSGG